MKYLKRKIFINDFIFSCSFAWSSLAKVTFKNIYENLKKDSLKKSFVNINESLAIWKLALNC